MLLRWPRRVKRSDCSTWHESFLRLPIIRLCLKETGQKRFVRGRKERIPSSKSPLPGSEITGSFWGMQPFPAFQVLLIPLRGSRSTFLIYRGWSFKILICNHDWQAPESLCFRDFKFLLDRMHFFFFFF